MDTNYIVFVKQGYDRQYFCVAGREINHKDAICFINYNEAHNYANELNKKRAEKASNESRSSS